MGRRHVRGLPVSVLGGLPRGPPWSPAPPSAHSSLVPRSARGEVGGEVFLSALSSAGGHPSTYKMCSWVPRGQTPEDLGAGARGGAILGRHVNHIYFSGLQQMFKAADCWALSRAPGTGVWETSEPVQGRAACGAPSTEPGVPWNSGSGC